MTIALLHIPKTAGTSYTAFLADGLPGDHLVKRLNATDAADFVHQLDPDALRPYSLVAGHFDYELCHRAPFLRPATLLRHPVERLASWYHDIRRSPAEADAPWRRLIEARRLTVEDFLLHPTVQRLHGQTMTEMVAGFGFSRGVPPNAEATLALAKANLETFAHVALHERLDDSAALARAELGIEPSAEVPHLNAGPPSASLPADLRDHVARRLALDAELYAWAVEVFERRMTEQGIGRSVAPPVRTTTALPLHPSAPPRGPRRRRRAKVGDRLALAWEPPEATVLGAPLAARSNTAVLRFDEVTERHGGTFTIEAPGPDDGGRIGVRVPTGLYHAQVTVPCWPCTPPAEPWTILLAFAWCGDPPIPAGEGLPGNPEVAVWRHQTIRDCLPVVPRRGTPITESALIRAPVSSGQLFVVLGSSVPVQTRPGDRLALDYLRVG